MDTCAAYEQTFLNTIAYDSREWSKVRIHYTKELTISKPIYLVSMSKSLNDSKKAEAIKRFEDFLLREDVQQELIGLGYRPVKTTAAIEAELAGLEEKYGDYGFQAELPELRDSLDYSFFAGVSGCLSQIHSRALEFLADAEETETEETGEDSSHLFLHFRRGQFSLFNFRREILPLFVQGGDSSHFLHFSACQDSEQFCINFSGL